MRQILPLVSLSAALSLVLSACGNGQANTPKEEPEARVAVEVTKPHRSELLREFQGTATLSAEREAVLVSESAGEIKQVLVEEGDHVRAGQVLARLDGERARLSLAQIEAVEKRLDHEANRSAMLLSRQMIASELADRAQYERDAQRAAADLAKLSLDKTEIRAPYDGVITRRHIKTGQWMAAHAPAFEIADFSDLVADLSVPERELAGLMAGQPVRVRVDALAGQVFTGKVERVAAVVDAQSGTGTIRIDLDETGALRPGLFARLSIERERIADALLLPQAALVGDADAPFVYVVRGGRAERVQPGLRLGAGGWAQIVSGLDEQSQVVTLGQSLLSAGDLVEVVGAASEGAAGAL